MRNFLITFFFLATILIAYNAHLTAATSKSNVYLIGFCDDGDLQSQGQKKVILNDIISRISKKYKIRLKLKWFANNDEYVEASRGSSYDAFYSPFYNIDLFLNSNYRPALRFANKDLHCIYVKNGSSISDVSKLKGKRLITYPFANDYYSISKMLGDNPDDVFKKISTSGSESRIYSLILNQADAAYLSVNSYNSMANSNPTLKNAVHSLLCGEEYPLAPFFVRSGADQEISELLIKILMNPEKEASLKEYQPYMEQKRFHVVPVMEGDYKGVVNLYLDAKKKGWDKKYTKWVNSNQTNE